MQTHFDLNELNQFIGSQYFYKHWGNKKLVYTEGIQYFAKRLDCYWLIEEIAYVILPKLLQDYFDYFYCINFYVNEDLSAMLELNDGNGNIHFTHKISWTDFMVRGKIIKFYICESDNHYCLMLPSEY